MCNILTTILDHSIQKNTSDLKEDIVLFFPLRRFYLNTPPFTCKNVRGTLARDKRIATLRGFIGRDPHDMRQDLPYT